MDRHGIDTSGPRSADNASYLTPWYDATDESMCPYRGVHGRIFFVDDDTSVRDAVASLLKAHGYAVTTFGSAKELLAHGVPLAADCLILDAQMPETSGSELQEELNALGSTVPIIFVTARPDDGIAARVLKAGARSFLLKPFTEDTLIAAIESAASR